MPITDRGNSYAVDQEYCASKKKMENGLESTTLSLAVTFRIIPDRNSCLSALTRLDFQVGCKKPVCCLAKKNVSFPIMIFILRDRKQIFFSGSHICSAGIGICKFWRCIL